MHREQCDDRDYPRLATESRNKADAALDVPLLRQRYLALAVSHDRLATSMERQFTDVRYP